MAWLGSSTDTDDVPPPQVTPLFLDDISPVAASTRPSECGGDSEKRRLADGGPKRDYRGWADRGKDALIERLWRRKRGSS